MTEETRTTSATGGEKGVKAQRHDLLPRTALDVASEVYAFGAIKYADHNWRKRYEWSKSYAALQRHLTAWWDGEDVDSESGLSHLGHAMFHAFALATWEREDGSGVENQMDDRWRTAFARAALEDEGDGSIHFAPTGSDAEPIHDLGAVVDDQEEWSRSGWFQPSVEESLTKMVAGFDLPWEKVTIVSPNFAPATIDLLTLGYVREPRFVVGSDGTTGDVVKPLRPEEEQALADGYICVGRDAERSTWWRPQESKPYDFRATMQQVAVHEQNHRDNLLARNMVAIRRPIEYDEGYLARAQLNAFINPA